MKRIFQILFLIFLTGVVSAVAGERLEAARLDDVTDTFSKDLPLLLIETDGHVFELRLYDNDVARQVVASLPQTVVMSRWGDGVYYGKLAQKIQVKNEETRRAYKPGEVALRLHKNTLCLFFGPTPASLTTDTPMMSSAGVAIGQMVAYAELDQLPGVTDITVRVKK